VTCQREVWAKGIEAFFPPGFMTAILRMVRPPRVIAQRVLDDGLQGSGRQFLLPDESGFLISNRSGIIQRLDPDTLQETARVRTADVPGAFAAKEGGKTTVCCTWHRVFSLDSLSLAIRAQASLGEGLGCLDLDAEEDHLAVGSMGSVQLLKAVGFDGQARKRIGGVSVIARTPDSHVVTLLQGTAGRIKWLDCEKAQIIYELEVPHFGDAVGDGSRVYLALGELTKYQPDAIGPGGQKVVVPPIDLVRPGAGVVVIDTKHRTILAQYPSPPFAGNPCPLQVSSARQRLFVFCGTGSIRLIRSIQLNTGQVDFDWPLPENAVPLAVLDEGRRAIVADERMRWQRLLLIERD